MQATPEQREVQQEAETYREDDPRHSVHRWTRGEYHQMIAAGLFDGMRVELLDGEIWDMASQLTPHATCVRKTALALREVFAEGYVVDMQLPIATTLWSEPEPDVCVAAGTPDDYADHHPGPEEIMLLVEASDTSLRKDRTKKLRAYARAGIAEYWIVNLVNDQLEVHRRPTPDGTYLEKNIYLRAGFVEPLNASGKTVAVADLLPPLKQL